MVSKIPKSKEYQIRRSYDQSSEAYNQRYREIQSKKYRQGLRILKVDLHFPLIDLGGGTGLLSEVYSGRIVNLDISRGMLDKDHSMSDRVIADLRYLPIRHRSIHQAVSFTAYQNLSNPQQGLQELEYASSVNCSIFVTVLKFAKVFESGTQQLQEIFQQVGWTVKKCGQLPPEDIYCLGKLTKA